MIAEAPALAVALYALLLVRDVRQEVRELVTRLDELARRSRDRD